MVYGTGLVPEPVRKHLRRVFKGLGKHSESGDKEKQKTHTGPERNTYRVAVHWGYFENGEYAAKVAATYISKALNEIWPTEVVVGEQAPKSATEDYEYIPWMNSGKKSAYEYYEGPEVEADQHILLAKGTGSHGSADTARVGGCHVLTKMENKYSKYGYTWPDAIIATILHEVAHGLGPEHEDGESVTYNWDSCVTPMDEPRGSNECYAHHYSEKSKKKIKSWMEENIGYKYQ